MAKQTKKSQGLWLFKEEPSHYSYEDLMADKETVWDGVTNNLARQNLGKVAQGDRVLYYHTGKQKAIVGEMKVTTDPFINPETKEPKALVVKVKPVKRWKNPVTLEQIKKEPSLADWDLIRLPRLSVVPVTLIQWNRVAELSQEVS